MIARRGPAALLLAGALVLLTGAPALAAPPIGGGGTTGGTGKPKAPSTGTTKTGGTTTKPKPPPSSKETVTSIWFPGPHPDCPATDADGDPISGVLLRIVTSNETTLSGSSTCVYKTPTQVYTLICGVDVSASYRGPYSNPALSTRTVAFPRKTTRFGAGERTVAACNDSASASFLTDADGFGHHELVVRSTQVRCQAVTYTDGTTSFRSCGSPYVSSASTTHLTVWCGGWAKGLAWPGWTADACEGPGEKWKCVVPTPMVDGRWPARRADRRELFADGKQHTLTFGSGPAAPGLGSAVFRPGQLVESKASAPKRPAWEEVRTGVSSWNARWWGGSTRTQPWQATARWTVDGTLTSAYPKAITVNVDGSTTVSQGTRTARVTGSCSSEIVIDQKRASNTAS